MNYVIKISTSDPKEGEKYPENNTVYEQTISVEDVDITDVIAVVNGLNKKD